MRKHIAFLHTSPVHIETFERLVRATDPTLEVEHIVAQNLLAEAQRLGSNNPTVIGHVQDAMTRSASNGASIVICTCSTIGAAAERTPRSKSLVFGRIDRAMADRAVELGPRILIVAALESTLGPTVELVQESAASLRVSVSLNQLFVSGAWLHFLNGNHHAYIESIAAAVRTATDAIDVVVLAQASMAPAADLLTDLNVEVLSSPMLGVQSALATLRSNLSYIPKGLHNKPNYGKDA